MKIVWKLVAAIFGGFLFAFMGMMVTALSGLASEGGAGGVVFLVAWALGAAIALISPRAGKSWRYLLVCCALLSLAMPLSTLIFAGGSVSEAGSQGAAAATGAAIGGGLATAMSGFIGFFLAAIFLIIGLLVGRDKSAS